MDARRGFTLLEVLIVLVIAAVLASGLAVPLAAQVHLRRVEDTRRLLEQAGEALLGFAVAHGRLPCPATAASRGLEAFAAGGDAASGTCATFHGGFLPAAALGLAPLDEDGFARDAWSLGAASRVRYAVHGGTIGGVSHALTRADGMQMATLPALAGAGHYLYVCATGAAAGPGGCGPAAHQLTRRAAFVLLAPGANAGEAPPAGSDEARNLDGDAAFVWRAAGGPGREFDDLLHWGAIHLVVNRLVLAGRLP